MFKLFTLERLRFIVNLLHRQFPCKDLCVTSWVIKCATVCYNNLGGGIEKLWYVLINVIEIYPDPLNRENW